MSQKAGNEADLIHARYERGSSSNNAQSDVLISALSEDGIRALSDDGINALSDPRSVSRVKLGRIEYYGKPELYHNRWKAQYIAKFPNSKLARHHFKGRCECIPTRLHFRLLLFLCCRMHVFVPLLSPL